MPPTAMHPSARLKRKSGSSPVDPGTRQALRAIAGFEAFKGVAAAVAALGLLSLLHHDVHRVLAALIGHVGLRPGDHYPALFLRDVDDLLGADHRSLLLGVCAYVMVRFAEAYGLWTARAWGVWLGAVSGALYVPFELWHMVHQPTLLTSAVVTANLALVGFLAWQFWHRQAAPAVNGKARG